MLIINIKLNNEVKFLTHEPGSREYFDRVASKWNEMRRSFYTEEVREAAYRKAGLVPGKTAADIGCGTGFITEKEIP